MTEQLLKRKKNIEEEIRTFDMIKKTGNIDLPVFFIFEANPNN